ncbi:ferredoxin family protein [Wolbachia endosymbiont of Howardula sp.]|uniref:ferredoxin family protein n=1 Tax=Wolbachia endosymbiont of Howardula sp. TaxID=2916816 RepID=UPI00217D0945|nr:ferredoxin family protein [Wolbachia endosymbiont of Howardula sp.]UWI83394.1 ferredoxin family protein [Wolbachia endosymbiont of Howardula sp.]
MTHFVTDKCIKCKYTDCVEVCPVDCFYEGKNMLVINPDECIDCGVCIPECPLDAIVTDDAVIDILTLDPQTLNPVQNNLKLFYSINIEYSQKWPKITYKKDPLSTASEFQYKVEKVDFFQENLE